MAATAPASEAFNAALLGYVADVMRNRGVPAHAHQHVLENWGEVRQWMREHGGGDDMTIRSMQPLLQKYIEARTSPEEQAEMFAYRQNIKRATELKNMSDRTLLEAIYKKLHW